MPDQQQVTLPITDKSIIRIALAKAGNYQVLKDMTGVDRTTCWRLLNGRRNRLQSGTREKLVDYINAE